MALFIFILILISLILVHEFGHFVVAKLFGIKVEEFGIFFPPRLFAKKFGETVYSFNLLPVGGFVKIFGEQTDESNPSVEADPRSFVHKSRPVQAAVIVAGIVCNILFAWLILSVGYMVGMQTSRDHAGWGQVQHPQTTIVGVVAGSPAAKVGLKAEDVVIGIQTGTAQLPLGSDSTGVQAFIVAHQDESMVFSVVRESACEDRDPCPTQNFLAKPTEGLTPGHKAVGIELDDVGVLKLSPPLALAQGGLLAYHMTLGTAVGLGSFFASVVTGSAHWGDVSGPIGIATVGSSAVHSGFAATVFLAALISINLAIINLVPIPGLDGGRLLFIGIEAVLRRPISEKTATRFAVAGFSLLALLMLVVSFHDILKLIHGV